MSRITEQIEELKSGACGVLDVAALLQKDGSKGGVCLEVLAEQMIRGIDELEKVLTKKGGEEN